jgi:DNA repair exonuclease SbcCD ATPase subunit
VVIVVIILEVENIGGLVGKHKFEFKEGLSEVIAPNATGKTSLIKALLAMYTPDITPNELLNYDADEGYIKMNVNGRTFLRRFKREKEKVIEIDSSPVATDDRIRFTVLDPQLGEVVRRLVSETKPDITDYLTKIFKLDEYENRKNELKLHIENLEREMEHLKEDVKELAKVDEERKRLEGERKELKKELEKMKAVSIERVHEIDEHIWYLNKRIGEIDSRIKDLEESLIPVTEEKIKELQLEVERLRKIVDEFYEHNREPDKYIENIRERIEQVDSLREKFRKELEGYINSLDARIPVIKMAMTMRDTRCPICGAFIERPEVFWSSRLKETEEEVRKSKEAIIKDYEERISKAENERTKLWKELEILTKKYNDVREIEAISLPRYKSQLEEENKDLENYKKELFKLKNERNIIIKELEELKRGLSEEEKKVAEKRAEIERRLGEIEQRIKDVEEHITKKSESGRRLTEVSKKIEELRMELERIERELYNILTTMKDEFANIASEIIKKLNFVWLKSIRLVKNEAKKSFEIKVVRIFPSGREMEQPINTLSTSERLALSLIVVLTGYKLKMLEEYKGVMPIIADEALLVFDPQRFEKVADELKKYAKYIVITRLARSDEVPKLTIVYKH